MSWGRSCTFHFLSVHGLALLLKHFLFLFSQLVCLCFRFRGPHISPISSFLPPLIPSAFVFLPCPQRPIKMFSFSYSAQILTLQPSSIPWPTSGCAGTWPLCSFLPLPFLPFLPEGRKVSCLLAFSVWYTSGFLLAPPGVEGVGGNLIWAWPGEGGSPGLPLP